MAFNRTERNYGSSGVKISNYKLQITNKYKIINLKFKAYLELEI